MLGCDLVLKAIQPRCLPQPLPARGWSELESGSWLALSVQTEFSSWAPGGTDRFQKDVTPGETGAGRILDHSGWSLRVCEREQCLSWHEGGVWPHGNFGVGLYGPLSLQDPLHVGQGIQQSCEATLVLWGAYSLPWNTLTYNCATGSQDLSPSVLTLQAEFHPALE